MSTASNFYRMRREEYLAFERASETQQEFLREEVFARSGLSLSHDRITREHYLPVAQDSTEIEMYTHNDNGTWTFSDHSPTGDVFIDTIQCHGKWEDLDAHVTFEMTKEKPSDA